MNGSYTQSLARNGMLVRAAHTVAAKNKQRPRQALRKVQFYDRLSSIGR